MSNPKCLVDEARLYDAQGRLATNAIFFETNNARIRDKYPPSYTLKVRDYKPEGFTEELISAYRVYMDAVDEYDAAIKLVGNMGNWDYLCKLDWFMKGKKQPAISHLGLETWREHKRAKVKSEAMAVLQEKVKDGDTTASRAILAEIKEPAVPKRRGAPKKASAASKTPLERSVDDFLKRVK